MKNFILLFLFISIYNVKAQGFPKKIIETNVESDKNVKYTIAEDKHNVFVNVETDDKRISYKMLKEGITVYFDIKGKKKKNVFVQFPKEVESPNEQKGRRPPGREEEQQPSREELMLNLPQEAMYSYFDDKREFHTLLNDFDVNISFELLGNNKVKYSLRIPKSRVNSNPKKDMAKLTVGVFIGKNREDRLSNGGGPGPGGQSGVQFRGGSQAGGPRGGGRGGRPQGRGRSGSGGGQGPSQQRSSQESSVLVHWFSANLFQNI